ncbi:MAG: ExeA family protein [Succinivibrionaceae bacterium]
MYESFFGLLEPAFSISPNPKFFFMSIHHKQALSMLKRGITDSGGFLLFTGEVGTGKTVILRKLLNELPSNIEKAVIYNPKMSLNDILIKICHEFGISVNKDFSKSDLIEALNKYITSLYDLNKRAVIVIDEAQHLPDDCIEEVRLLTNIETDNTKLLQVILVGQPELKEKLAQVHMRQVSQRITGRFHLLPLSLEETDAYVRFRMQAAGCVQIVFSNVAIKELYKVTQGIPRMINVVSDKALNQAYICNSNHVEKEHMKMAIKEALGSDDDLKFSKNNTLKNKQQDRDYNLKRFIPKLIILYILFLGLGSGISYLANSNDEQEKKKLAIEYIKQDRELTDKRKLLYQLVSKQEEINSFNREYARFSADVSNNVFVENAWNNLLSEWGFANNGSSIDSDCKSLVSKGFICFKGKGNIKDLERYNIPVIIHMMDSSLNTFYAVLTKLSDQYATLVINGREWNFYRSYIEQSMEGDIMLIWPLPYGQTSINNNSPKEVQEELSFMLGKYFGNENYIFLGWNKDFESKVKMFQEKHGLTVDGIVGIDTLWALLPYADTGKQLKVNKILVEDKFNELKNIFGDVDIKKMLFLKKNNNPIPKKEKKVFNENISLEDLNFE